MPFGEYGLAVHYRELSEALKRLHISQCAVVGHSFGAMLGVWLAAHEPERVTHLVLIDGGAPPNPHEVRALNAYYDSMAYRYPSLDAYIERYKTHPLYQPYTEELDALLRSNLRQQPDAAICASWRATCWTPSGRPPPSPSGRTCRACTPKCAAQC